MPDETLPNAPIVTDTLDVAMKAMVGPKWTPVGVYANMGVLSLVLCRLNREKELEFTQRYVKTGQLGDDRIDPDTGEWIADAN